MTNKEAAAKLGCSVSTAQRYSCAWCDQSMLNVAHGVCGAIWPPKCDTEAKAKAFSERRQKQSA